MERIGVEGISLARGTIQENTIIQDYIEKEIKANIPKKDNRNIS